MDIRGLLILPIGLWVMACNKSALPLPISGPNEGAAPVVVPYPPPAARAEIIPAKPGNRVVWIDGSWTWDRRHWVWQRGRWEVPPKGAHYATAKVEPLPDGSLGWFVGGWQTANGQPVRPSRSD